MSDKKQSEPPGNNHDKEEWFRKIIEELPYPVEVCDAEVVGVRLKLFREKGFRFVEGPSIYMRQAGS